MDDSLAVPDDRTLAAYLSELRSVQPTPGGGSASAYCGALGAGLAAMVCRLTIGRASPDERAVLTDLTTTYDSLVDRLSQAARDDELCFTSYQLATRLPKGTDDERRIRTAARQEALRLAAEAPLHAGELAVTAFQSLPTVARLGTHHAVSDVRVARALLDASLEGSLINVQVNLDMITDEAASQKLGARLTELRSSASEAVAQVEAELALRG